ncbi:MAG: hypothetical protein Q7S35_00115 [Candidatus Limnocylindrales bacterium]|nr:hypothetical protein [Candidatus Limnocylindrales bacterium]
MATETDAARDRVLAARAALGEELEALEASARAAVDIPAKVRRSPAKAAAIAGSAGFVVLGGPKRLFGAARRAVFGPTAELPKRMLPDEIEKTLSKLGADGEKVRGALERDFAAYVREAEKDRGIAPLLSTAVAKPLLMRGAKAAAEWLFRTDEEGFQARLAEVRERARDEVAKRKDGSDRTSQPGTPIADDESGSAGA